MKTVMTYNGYELVAMPHGGYQCTINGKVRKFDTAGMWKQYIDYLSTHAK